MKVGDYVRTKDYQNIRSRIGKIIRQDGKYYYLDIDEDTQMVWEEDTVLKSSPNIISLIQVGDYVNGREVYQVGYNIQDDFVLKMSESNYEDFIYEDEIKSIVTREMFESMEYKVKE